MDFTEKSPFVYNETSLKDALTQLLEKWNGL